MKNYFFLILITSVGISSSCSHKDPCSNKLCYNGGTCVDGTCNCAPGFSGNDCSLQKFPVSMTITSLTMTAYPGALPNGNPWDYYSCCPDPYLTINTGTDPDFSGWVSSYYAVDADSTLVNFTDGFPFTISPTTVSWTIDCWDFDGYGNAYDDFMGKCFFVPAANDLGWPSSFTVSDSNFTFVLQVQWTF